MTASELAELLDLLYGMSLAGIAHTLRLLEQHLLSLEAGQGLLADLLTLYEQPSSFRPVAELGGRSLCESHSLAGSPDTHPRQAGLGRGGPGGKAGSSRAIVRYDRATGA